MLCAEISQGIHIYEYFHSFILMVKLHFTIIVFSLLSLLKKPYFGLLCSSLVEHLQSMYEALGSIHSMAKKGKNG
jgi:hypothetical protein